MEGEPSKDWLQQVEKLYESLKTEIPEENRTVTALYEQWLGGTESEKAGKALHTEYHAVEKASTGFNIKWWRLMLEADCEAWILLVPFKLILFRILKRQPQFCAITGELQFLTLSQGEGNVHTDRQC